MHYCAPLSGNKTGKQGKESNRTLTQRVKFISDELTHLYGVNDIYYIEKSYRYH